MIQLDYTDKTIPALVRAEAWRNDDGADGLIANSLLLDVLEWLGGSGALIPVPWGGPRELRKCWTNHCLYKGLVYSVEVTYGAHCLSSQSAETPGWSDLVQPVTLVPIGEMAGLHNG